MVITENRANDELTLALEGRLDTSTAPALDAYVAKIEDIALLTLDFAKLEYISSAGLRALLALQKKQQKSNGKMVIKNVCETIAEVFEITGFSDILTIE